MKIFGIIAAAFLAVAAADSCDTTKLVQVVTGANASQCSKDSGMNFLPPSNPTPEQLPKLCGSSACKAFLAELKNAAPAECTIPITNPPLQLYGQVINPIEQACAASTAPTTAPTTTPTTTPTTAPTTTPTTAPTTAPTTGPTPAPTTAPTTAPTPAPTRNAC
jgi:hypothetical protein